MRASTYRLLVLAALRDWPKTTGQVSQATGLSLAHASRTIRELVDRGLSATLTPEPRGRGRLYGLSPAGLELANSIGGGSRRLQTVPLVRATHPTAWFRALCERVGAGSAWPAAQSAGLVAAINGRADEWIPLRAQLTFLEEIEKRFGDGSYGIVRSLGRSALRHYPSVRRYALRALPLRYVLDTAPSSYLREFNHGRIEIDTSEGIGIFKHFDWSSSKARCAAWLGSWEGFFEMRRIAARVSKRACILAGDEFCSYRAEWTE